MLSEVESQSALYIYIYQMVRSKLYQKAFFQPHHTTTPTQVKPVPTVPSYSRNVAPRPRAA